MGNVERIQPYLEPLRRSIVVSRPPHEAFEIFTSRFGSWWPYTRFSLHQAETESCGFEPRAGGEIFELAKGGKRERWGSVLAWDPPRGFTMSWHPGQPSETATEVEVRFIAVPEGTRVELEHREWQRLGERAVESRQSYEGGWPYVFDVCFLGACS